MATAITSSRNIWLLSEILVAAWVSAATAEPGRFESHQITPAGEYTFGIEGPAADTAGRLYVVNFGKQGTIGMLGPGASASELFVVLPAGSVGNAIRFDRDGRMYVADYKNHNVFVFARGRHEPQVYFHSDGFNQPNDLTVAADGTLYASDPHWRHRDGQVWRIVRGPDGAGIGEVMTAGRKMGTTNGIDLSPDGATLYVGESETREIWAYRLDGPKLAAPRLVKRFPDFSLDGLRTDVDGRLYVTRILKGTIAVLAPDGDIIREIPLHAKEPTNLAFGGPDGMTVFVTQRQGGFIEAFRVDRPGREYCLQTADVLCRASLGASVPPQSK
jgi:sugar lactone lactonase YvrE